MLKDFKKFILRGNTVDLAVAVVVGGAFGAIVTALVKDMITPLVAAIVGKPDFSHLKFSIGQGVFMYGDFLNAVVSFLLIATVVFFFVVQPLNKLMAIAIKSKDTEEATTKKCPECLSEVPNEATRCKFCTTKLTAK
jgi:large conductance mechanosensitive channel